eukprot:4800292-Prymnesium_polylepis.2
MALLRNDDACELIAAIYTERHHNLVPLLAKHFVRRERIARTETTRHKYVERLVGESQRRSHRVCHDDDSIGRGRSPRKASGRPQSSASEAKGVRE